MKNLIGVFVVAAAMGCGVGTGDVGDLPCASALCEDNGGADDGGGDDGAGANDDGAGETGDTGDGAGESGDGGDDGGSAAGGIPCDVVDALASQCWECHSATPSYGAPMPLMSVNDFHVPSSSDNTRPVYEVALDRMSSDGLPMPPGGASDPDAAQTLQQWLTAEAPEDPSADCGDAPPPPDGPDNTGVDDLPCEPSAVFAAHAPDGGKFDVPEDATDLYQCFAFSSPFEASSQATAWAPVIDDSRVVHHWILYKSTTGNYQHGSVFPCDVSLQLSASFVAGWAPGGENVVLPDEAGLELGGSDTTYILQVHYHNEAGYTDAADNTGVAFCTADTPRPNVAGVLTLGTISINVPPGATNHEATGSCNPWQNGGWPPLHVIASSPHMHELGRALYTQVEGGPTVTSIPNFDFNQQLMYPTQGDVVLNPGDTITTTCVYDNPTDHTVNFGEGTADEMCFNFVLVYPIDQLADRNCGISPFG